MKNKFLKIFGLLVTGSLVMTSCIKDDLVQLTDQGTTRVKISQAPKNQLYFAPFTDVKTIDLFDLRRDVPSNAELNKSTNVQVKVMPSLLDAYNEENGTNIEMLPDSLFTTSVPGTGGVYDMSFAPGQTAFPFTIKVDGSKWDVSHNYALPVVISSLTGATASADMDTVIAILSVINQWDGVYEVTGTMTDNASPTLTGLFPMELHLITQSKTSVAVFDPEYWGDYFIPIKSGTSVSGYGSFAPVFEINPETNKVEKVTNLYGQPAGNTRSAGLDPSGLNYYDPATKTLYVKFFMYQPSSVPAAPHIRTAFDWTMKYTGAR